MVVSSLAEPDGIYASISLLSSISPFPLEPILYRDTNVANTFYKI